MPPTESVPNKPKNSLKPFLLIAFAVIVAGLIFGNIKLYSKLESNLRKSRIDLALKDFIVDLQNNQLQAAATHMSTGFQQNLVNTKEASGNIDFTKSDAMNKVTETKSKSNISQLDALKALASLPSFKAINNPYKIYKTPGQNSTQDNQKLTVRFTTSQGKTYDFSVQLTKQNDTWYVNALSVPDPTDGIQG
ncbi:MAG TPA: hypothetical protein VLE69_01965 [Candidatus Saccharimonadales bacterium]|nr:hypothetical protein [Candidatus Saccharimonadales bacterium]